MNLASAVQQTLAESGVKVRLAAWCRLSGVTRQLLYRSPSMATIRRVAKALGVPASRLLALMEDK